MSEVEIPVADVKAVVVAKGEANDATHTVQKSANDDDGKDGEDLYGYLKRDHFTSEVYKLEIGNLPGFFKFSHIQTQLKKLGITPLKIKTTKAGGINCAFITFRSSAECSTAATQLEGVSWKGRLLTCRPARPMKDPYLRRRAERNTDNPTNTTESGPLERLREAVEPLAGEEYEKQLEEKTLAMRNFLKKLAHRVTEVNSLFSLALDQMRIQHGAAHCIFSEIKHSPKVTKYRNKSEFTIGFGDQGEDVTVGFRAGSYASGSCCVLDPSDSMVTPDATKRVAAVIQRYVSEISTLKPFDQRNHTGNWRQVLVRESSKGGLLAVAQLQLQDLTAEDIEKEKASLFEFMTLECPSLTGLYLHVSKLNTEVSVQPDSQVEHLSGVPYIEEELLGLSFRINMEAFFQVNATAAEVLYQTVGEMAPLSPTSTLLLDLCCGTGTIGQCLAPRVSHVIGIELNEAAVKDAEHNAEVNGLSDKTEYICSPLEKCLLSTLKSRRETEIVAILDPPRAGAHSNVIHAIRSCPAIKTLVYVSCHPNGAMQNLLDLQRSESKRLKGAPFIITRACPVDLFPQTRHCELVMVLKRCDLVQLSFGIREIEDAASYTGSQIPEKMAKLDDAK